jgi:hypothetical protein
MITALRLIFSPFEAWEKITTAQRGFIWILFVYLVPFLVIALGVEGFLLSWWGQSGEFGFFKRLPPEQAARYCAAYFVFLLVGVNLSAKFLSLASESFNVHTSYLQCLTVMAYSFGPIILARILDGVPQINTWLCWAIGAAGSVSVLYHGIGMVLRPDQTKGFGLYLIAIIIMVMVSAVAHFAALSVLNGKVFRPHSAQGTSSSALSYRLQRAAESRPAGIWTA